MPTTMTFTPAAGEPASTFLTVKLREATAGRSRR